jgi:hypothetical protein
MGTGIKQTVGATHNVTTPWDPYVLRAEEACNPATIATAMRRKATTTNVSGSCAVTLNDEDRTHIAREKINARPPAD